MEEQERNRTFQKLGKNSKTSIDSLNLLRKNSDINKPEEDYNSFMNEGHEGIEENLKSHIFTPF